MANHNMPPLLVLISAPSGAGKTTVCQQLLAADANITRAVTCTTRPPRAGEKDGEDYYFLEETVFRRRLQAGEFLENATVYGYSYGLLKAEVLGRLRSGKDVLLNVDVQGAATIRARAGEDEELKRALVTVFLTTPTFAELESRLTKRGTDAPEVIQRRLGVARRELEEWRHFQYLLVSGTIPEDVRRMRAIMEAEKMRVARSHLPLL